MIDGRILAHLASKGIPCAAIGALALAAHGASRYSSDLDLLVMDASVLSESFWKGSGLESTKLKIRRGGADDPLAGVVRYEALLPVDIVVGKTRAAGFALDTAVPNPQLPCNVVTALGLVLLKLEAGGPKDIQDLEILRNAQKALTGWNMPEAVEPRLSLLGRHAKKTWRAFLTRYGRDSGADPDPFQGEDPHLPDSPSAADDGMEPGKRR